jgi:hypothetical protein
VNLLLRLYPVIRRSGWFVPGMTGGLFPFPVAWQAWALLAGLIVAITATVGLPDEPGWICRISLCAGYIGIGMPSYDGQ